MTAPLNLLISIALICVSAPSLALAAALDFSTPVTIATKNGEVTYHTALAITRAQQETGLMHREKLPLDQGMLFPQNPPRRMLMWMKNTLIPLDMLFIANGKVIYIARQMQPQSLQTVGPAEAVAAVLEITGGQSDKQGIAIGDRVQYSLPR